MGSSSGIICDGACMSNSQPVPSATFPAASEEATCNMDTEQFDVSAGDDASDSKKKSVFEGAFNDTFDNNFDNATESAFDGSFDTSQYPSQFMYENTWDSSMTTWAWKIYFPRMRHLISDTFKIDLGLQTFLTSAEGFSLKI
jgi:hypothetical protein